MNWPSLMADTPTAGTKLIVKFRRRCAQRSAVKRLRYTEPVLSTTNRPHEERAPRRRGVGEVPFYMRGNCDFRIFFVIVGFFREVNSASRGFAFFGVLIMFAP